MNAVGDLLRRLRDAGVELTLDGRKLQYRIPRTGELAAIKADLRRHKDQIVGALEDEKRSLESPSPSRGWNRVRELRRHAETADVLAAVWGATTDEVALRWELAGADDARWLPEDEDHRLQDQIGDALRAGDWRRALPSIDQWRDWRLEQLGQRDFESSGRLSVCHSFLGHGRVLPTQSAAAVDAGDLEALREHVEGRRAISQRPPSTIGATT